MPTVFKDTKYDLEYNNVFEEPAASIFRIDKQNFERINKK